MKLFGLGVVIAGFALAAVAQNAERPQHQPHQRVDRVSDTPQQQPQEHVRQHPQRATPDAAARGEAAREAAAKKTTKPPPSDCSEGTDCYQKRIDAEQAKVQERAEGAKRSAEKSPGAGKCSQTICANCDGICAPLTPGGNCVCQKRP